MDISTITVDDFKTQFTRDFPYPDETTSDDELHNYIQDDDITKAFLEAEQVFNENLFSEDRFVKLAFLYLSAHFLTVDIRTAMQGVSSKGEGIVNSKTAGSISESYSIPTVYSEDPVFSFYAKTGYGLKYLNMVVPLLRGNVACVSGWTQA